MSRLRHVSVSKLQGWTPNVLVSRQASIDQLHSRAESSKQHLLSSGMGRVEDKSIFFIFDATCTGSTQQGRTSFIGEVIDLDREVLVVLLPTAPPPSGAVTHSSLEEHETSMRRLSSAEGYSTFVRKDTLIVWTTLPSLSPLTTGNLICRTLMKRSFLAEKDTRIAPYQIS